MKIMITCTTNSIVDQMDERFGRAAYYCIYDKDAKTVDFLENEQVNAAGGAGLQAAQLASQQGVDVLITGRVGGKADQALKTAGIEVRTQEVCPVRDILRMYGFEE